MRPKGVGVSMKKFLINPKEKHKMKAKKNLKEYFLRKSIDKTSKSKDQFQS